MHKSNILIALTIMVATLIASCSDNMGAPDDRLASVSNLVEPMDAKEVVLETALSASLFFEWDYVNPSEVGVAAYQVAFDKVDGDFSDPLYVVNANQNGLANSVTVSHKDLNKIAGKAGITPSAAGSVKWTVFATKGTKTMKATKEHTLIVTRLGGFDEIPVSLYLTGAATEAGNNLSDALQLKTISEGVFEIYTRLTGGETYQFVSATTGDITEYSLTESNIVIGGNSEVEETGVYKLYLDFEIGSFSMKEVTKVGLFLNWSQQLIELPYVGNGVWEVTNYEITGLSDNDNNDDRYKFRMESSDGATEWRAVDNDSKPTGDPAYYYMVERTNVEQWTDGQIWKTPATDGWSGKTYDITFSLNPQGPYTHNLVIK